MCIVNHEASHHGKQNTTGRGSIREEVPRRRAARRILRDNGGRRETPAFLVDVCGWLLGCLELGSGSQQCSQMVSKRRLQQQALAISFASIIYNALEGGVSIGFGSESSSRSLVFFGIQSGIEVISAALVVWRFRKVARPGEEAQSDISPSELKFEKIATLSIAGLLLCLSIGTEVSSIVSLALHHTPDSSNTTLIISSTALVIMILIWLPKRYLARALNSSTMQGEATCSLSCIQITTVLLIGAVVFRVWRGGWWVDGATSLALGLLFGWEGIKMVRWALNPAFKGGCCEDCSPASKLTPGGDSELGIRYRDICECCQEKEDCRNASECKCPTDFETSCCKPISDAEARCCTREIIPGILPPVAAAGQTTNDTCHQVTCDCCTRKDTCHRDSEGCRDVSEVGLTCCEPIMEVMTECCSREARSAPCPPIKVLHEPKTRPGADAPVVNVISTV
ncbi:hypothetical protein K439DRAFT_1619982 [Ramaria rubella]|nr:hypothetical protein K439DRAFT_1619982 [Ramaria rubella]